MPRHPDPDLEQRILAAASRLWARGGEKALTMRAVAKAAGTTTPTVYERYRDRDDILRALRLQTRANCLPPSAAPARCARPSSAHLEFRPRAQPRLRSACSMAWASRLPCMSPGLRSISCASAWPNVWEETPRQHTRLMLAVWSLMHGTAMLIIRGGFEGALRTQTIHACLDAFDAIVDAAGAIQGLCSIGPKWPSNLILGEGKQSRVGNGDGDQPKRKSEASPHVNASKPAS